MDIVIWILGGVLMLFGGVQVLRFIVGIIESAISAMLTFAMFGVGLAFIILVGKAIF